MAIYLDKVPSQYGRVYDTNVMYYQIHSTNYQQTNFTYLISLVRYTWNGANWVQNIVDTKKLYPGDSGYIYVNPTDVWKNYLSPSNQQFDFDASITGITEAINSIGMFGLIAQESYGNPPTLHSSALQQLLWVYNGTQQFVSYDSVLAGSGQPGGGNYQWVMMTGTTGGPGGFYGTGNFLTDAGNFYLDDDDYGFLYFINPPNCHIDQIEYQIYFPNTGVTYNGSSGSSGTSGTSPGGWGIDIPDSGGTFGYTYTSYSGFTDNLSSQSITESSNQTFVKSNINNISVSRTTNQVVPPQPWVGPYTRIIINETGMTYPNGAGSSMFYIPIGMKTIHQKFPGLRTDWFQYCINIYKKNNGGGGVGQYSPLNEYPFFVYRTNRDCRFDKYQVVWLNAHGGYDIQVFDKGSVIKEKERRDSFIQDLPPAYSYYQAGEKIYNLNPDEEITLTTSIIESQDQMQMLSLMFHSPQVFILATYKYYVGNRWPITWIYKTIAIPYIVLDNEMVYQQMQTDQAFTVSVTLRPANARMVQKL